MKCRAACAVMAAVVVPLVAGCEANTGPGPGAQPLGAGSTLTRPPQLPKKTNAVAALVRHGANSITSTRFTVTLRRGTDRLTGSGRETMQAGAVTGLALTLHGAGLPDTRVVIVAGTTFVRLPNHAWQHLPAAGGKAPLPAVRRALAAVAPLVSPAAMLATVASGDVQLLGSGVLASVPFARYAATTAVAVLPASPARAVWTRGGVAQVRLDLRVERHGRPLIAQWRLSGPSARADATAHARFRAYNRPLRITAPR